MQRDLQATVDGSIAGGIATVAMSALMLAARKAGLMGRLPPQHIAQAVLKAGGKHDASEELQALTATFLHFAFGAGIGALFAVLHRRLRLPIGAMPHALLFSSGVWAVSYKGWVPALGIMPPPERDRQDRPVVMLVAHWVYGVTLGAAVNRSS